MYIILLTFADNRRDAPHHLAAHKAWLQRGAEDGVFIMWGTLGEDRGGAILANGGTHAEIEARVAEDPFVGAGVVRPEVLEFRPAHAVPPFDALIARNEAA